MTPALGTRSPETRHLNLKWSVSDVDTIIRSVRGRWTAREICKRFGRGLTVDDVERICRDANPSIYLYRRTQEAGS